jgi:hypothetical protein
VVVADKAMVVGGTGVGVRVGGGLLGSSTATVGVGVIVLGGEFVAVAGNVVGIGGEVDVGADVQAATRAAVSISPMIL